MSSIHTLIIVQQSFWLRKASIRSTIGLMIERGILLEELLVVKLFIIHFIKLSLNLIHIDHNHLASLYIKHLVCLKCL